VGSLPGWGRSEPKRGFDGLTFGQIVCVWRFVTDRQSEMEVAAMAARTLEIGPFVPMPTAALPEPGGAGSDPPDVVAEILPDGTIRPRGDHRIEVDEDSPGWSTGHLAGRGWVLWWQRRAR
jgi:hypothetical protein